MATKTVYTTSYEFAGGIVNFSVNRHDEGYATITAIDELGIEQYGGKYPNMASAIKVLKVIANKAVTR